MQNLCKENFKTFLKDTKIPALLKSIFNLNTIQIKY